MAAGFFLLLSMTFFFWCFYYVFVGQRKKIWGQFALLSKSLGLTLDEGSRRSLIPVYPSLSGQYQNQATTVWIYRIGSGKHAQYFTCLGMTLSKSLSKSFRVCREGFLSKIGKALGMQDVVFGDEEFDRAFVVKASDEAFVKRIFSSKNRHLMLAQQATWSSGVLELHDNMIRFSATGVLQSQRQRELLEAMAGVVAGLAEDLQRF